jgi:hypothetical protein
MLLQVGNATRPLLAVNSVSSAIGIGTTSPGRLLALQDAQPIVYLNSTNSDNDYGFVFHDGGSGGSDDEYWFINDITQNTWNLGWRDTPAGAVSKYIVVRPTGNVGIGTTLPVGKLQIIASNTLAENNLYLKGTAGARVIISQPDGGCSSCGVDAAGTTWACVDTTCP